MPYPCPDNTDPIATTGKLNSLVIKTFPTAIIAGTTVMTTPWKGDVRDGALVLYQGAVAAFLDDGGEWSVTYEGLESFRLRRGHLPAGPTWKLTLRGTDGKKAYFRIGEEMAANARYVLAAKGVEQR